MKKGILIVAVALAAICGVSARATEASRPQMSDYINYCEQAGELYSVSPELIEAIFESDYKTPNLSGPMKLDRSAQLDRMKELKLDDVKDPEQAIEIGADYLLDLFEEYEDIYIVVETYLQLDVEHEYIADQIVDRAYELEGEHGKLLD